MKKQIIAYLREINLLNKGFSKYIIKYEDGRKIDIVEVIEEIVKKITAKRK